MNIDQKNKDKSCLSNKNLIPEYMNQSKTTNVVDSIDLDSSA